MINKIRNYGLIFSCCMSLAACYSDDGNYDYISLPDIKLEVQDIVATQFKTLELPVEVDLDGMSEEDYEFYWRIWPNTIGGIDKQKTICYTKELSYKVDEMPGLYVLLLTCHNKKTNVDVYKEISLSVQGTITEGWLVLNERSGKTDFDLIMSPYFSNKVEQDDIIRDLYESVNGEPLEGRGVKIGSYLSLGRYQYVTVLTDQGGARLDAITMQRAFDIKNLIRDGKPYRPQNYLYWNYYWSPGRYGYDAIISDGRFYEYSPIGGAGFNYYTEPILKNGMTYKASPYAPKWYDYHQGLIFDELRGGFIEIEQNSWILKEMPAPQPGQLFDWTHLNGTLLYMDTGFNNYEYGLIKDWNTHKMTLYSFNFDSNTNIAKGMYAADNCPELENALFYAVGSRGPLFFYATEQDVYLYDYSGSNTAKKVYSLPAAMNSDRKITGMKILKPYVDRYVVNHPYDNKVMVLSTYSEDTKEGKVYMYYINEGNGTFDLSSEKIFGGFGEILDMDFNWAKYGS